MLRTPEVNWSMDRKGGQALILRGSPSGHPAVYNALDMAMSERRFTPEAARQAWRTYQEIATSITEVMFQGGIVTNTGDILADNISRLGLNPRLKRLLEKESVVILGVPDANLVYQFSVKKPPHTKLIFVNNSLYSKLDGERTRDGGYIFKLDNPESPSQQSSISALVTAFEKVVGRTYGNNQVSHEVRISPITAVTQILHNIVLWRKNEEKMRRWR